MVGDCLPGGLCQYDPAAGVSLNPWWVWYSTPVPRNHNGKGMVRIRSGPGGHGILSLHPDRPGQILERSGMDMSFYHLILPR